MRRSNGTRVDTVLWRALVLTGCAWLPTAAGCTFTVDVDALQTGESGEGGTASPTSSASNAGGGGSGGAASSSSGGGQGGVGGGTTSAYAASVLADGPIAHFRFEDLAGPSCVNEVDGSIISCIYPTVDVQLGRPGADGLGHCLTADTALTNVFGPLDFPDEAPFTIEFWVRADPSLEGGGFGLLSDMSDPSNFVGRTGTWLNVDDTRTPFSQTWVDGEHTLYTNGKSVLKLPLDQWVHVALQHSDIDRLFVDLQTADNGALDGYVPRKVNDVPLSLGGLIGCIDELAIYDYALPVDRMAAHVAARGAD